VASHIYDTLEEAREQQIRFGGTINTLHQFIETEEPNVNVVPYCNPLDDGIEDENYIINNNTDTSITKTVTKGKPLFVLSLSDTKPLQNGFRYIKELLMQYHNHFINS
jgi:hypothetical protein